MSSFGSMGKECVERPRTRARQDQRRPGEKENDIRTKVIGIVVETDREEEREGKKHAAGRGYTPEKSHQRSEPDSQLAERDKQRHRRRRVKRRIEQMVKWTREYRTAQLLLEGTWGRGTEESTIGEFLQSRKAKRHTEKGSQDE
jgi:hypothetical protein